MVSTKNVIFETSFPMYCVRTLAGRHVLVAGGGGQAKTGVPNCLENFLFDIDAGSWDFRKTNVVYTGDEAAMNMDIFALNELDDGRYLVACGLGGNCRVYETRSDVSEFIDGQLLMTDSFPAKHAANSSHGENARAVENPAIKNGIINNNSTGTTKKSFLKKLKLTFRELRTFQTDFTPVAGPNSGGPFQKVVRFSPDASLLATGGTDGYFRIWKIASNFGKILERRAHKDDIDDLDFSPDGHRLVTVGRDATGFIWSVKNGTSKLTDLSDKNYDALPPRYRFRFCRFAKRIRPQPYSSKAGSSGNVKTVPVAATTNRTGHVLYTVSIPVLRTAKKQPCFLARWIVGDDSSNSFRCTLNANMPLNDGEVVSAFSISSDANYIGLGTLNGSITVVDASNMQLVQRWKEAHGIFVTSLDFVPAESRSDPRSPFCPLLTEAKCALISVSADNCGHLHLVPAERKRKMSTCSVFLCLLLFWAIIFYILVLLEF